MTPAPGRPPHVFTYTPVDLSRSYTPPPVPDAGATQFRYNRDRQLIGIDRPDGTSTGFVYDTGGRLSSVTFSRGTLQYTYDTAGRVATLADPGGVNLAFTYDGQLPVTDTWSGAVVGSISRTYDNDFRITAEQVGGTPAVAYTYDADGLVTVAGELGITRHAENGLITEATAGGTTELLEYNPFGEQSRQTGRVSSTDIFDVQYTRDDLGRITQRTEVIDGVTRVWGYGYDAAGRLEQVRRKGTVIQDYDYDANGNRLHAATEIGAFDGTYDDQDRLLSYGAAAFTYRPNGELATKTIGAQTTTYTYDTLGNLTQVTKPDGTIISYIVDGMGRRVGKAVNGVRVRSWLYADQTRPVAELDAANAVVARFVYASRPNVPDYMMRDGVTYRIFSDHLGSPRIVVDVASGTIVQRMDFGAFGEVTQDSNPGFQPFGFAGGLYDPDTGLVRFGARDYDPNVGRWTAKRPHRVHGRLREPLWLCHQRSRQSR